MKEYSKYLTNKNVALFGTISFHAFLLAIFTFINLEESIRETNIELAINFSEEELEEEIIKETPDDSESNVNIYDEFSEPFSNQASSRSSENTVEELRESMKSLDDARTNNDVDLFSEDAEKREIPLEHYKSETEGPGETERKVENSFTGRSTTNYFLEGRFHDKLPSPVYTCIDAGMVYIEIKVDQKGNVTDAKYIKGKSTSKNECLIETGLKYARRSKFNTNFSAKESQKGYITYTFRKN